METKVKEKREIRYKLYEQKLVVEVPVLLSDFVKENVLVQIINEVVDQIAMEELDQYYSGEGCPPYHPRMLIKVWLYGFCNKVYTSRPLARKLREDMGFMWLAGMQQPCFKTLSEFRGRRMKSLIDTVFKQVLAYLVEEGYVDLNDLYIDGSKWEANANRYKIVWRKNTERYKEAVLSRIDEILQRLEELQLAEDGKYGNRDLAEKLDSDQIHIVLNSEQLSARIKRVNDLIAEQKDEKKQRQLSSLNGKLEKESEKLHKYEEQEQILGNRNSYAKTDEDATALRMKDDRLLPGYNVQISSSNQYIVNGTIHENAADNPTLAEHVEQLEQRVEGLVEESWSPDVTTDAGYGSEENYELLESKNFTAYVKYPLWFKQISGQLSKQPYRRENWTYEEQGDYFLCPGRKKLLFREERQVVTQNGFTRLVRIYESEGCQGCPLFNECRGENTARDSNRTIQLSRQAEAYKDQVRARLETEEGLKKRAQRGVDVETPFGDIKYNMGHRRFILRSKEKVYIEFLLLAIAHNLRKVYCEKTGIWQDYYAQRAAKRTEKQQKRA